MKNIFYLSTLILLLFFAACEVLDVEPYLDIPAEEAINDRVGLERALIGSYDALQQAGYYGRNYLAVGDLPTDNLEWTGTTAGYNQIDNNSILSDNVIVESIWSSIYTALNRVNYVIEAAPGLTDLSDADLAHFTGEAHFLRALHHFNLIRLYGPVPLRTAPVSATETDLNVTRNSVEQVYEQILADLRTAASGLRAFETTARASKPAANALAARAFLTLYGQGLQTAYLDSAMVKAAQVIDDPAFALEPDYAALFGSESNSEVIFAVEFSSQDRNRLAEYFFTRELSGRKEFSPTPELMAAFEQEPVRGNVSVADTTDGPYVIKYADIMNGSDDVVVLRLAEMHLIMAEAEALKSGNTDLIKEHLNMIRQRASLDDVTSNDLQTLRLAIENERRMEFAFEGHRWFDLIRTRRAVEVIPGLDLECFALFPIPLTEIQANEAISPGDQNECY